jgi:hypothetical protein
VKVDVDGDGIIDGDLVTKYVDGKIAGHKFVKSEKLKNMVVKNNSAPKHSIQSKPRVYKNMPQVQNTNNQVMVQDKTEFGQYLKQGLGLGIGMEAGKTLVDGLESLF